MSKEREIALLEEALETIKLPPGDPNRGFGIIGRIQAYLKEHKPVADISLAEQYLGMIVDEELMKKEMMASMNLSENVSEEVKTLVISAFEKVLPEHKQCMIKLYNETFTQHELKELIEFRKKPAGRREVETRSHILDESRKFLIPRLFEEMNKLA